MNTTTTTTTTRKSIICTFVNHPPVRFWGEFNDPANGRYIDDYVDGTLWEARQDFGHHTINYYICKSGKRIYYASYNSGCTYSGREPRTERTYLKDTRAIEAYLRDISTAEWYRVCGQVDEALIVDSDLL